MVAKQEMTPDSEAQGHLEKIFNHWSLLENKLQSAASFFAYVSERIDVDSCKLDVPPAIAVRFESVCLWIRRVLPDLGAEVREQALEILNGVRPEETIATLNGLSDRDRRRILFRHATSIAAALASLFRVRHVGVDPATAALVNEAKLRNAKIGIGRLCSILTYAAEDLANPEPDEDIRSFVDHFNPAFVDRVRVNTLLEKLEEQVRELPDMVVKASILKSVGEIKQELKRRRPPWRRILGTLLLLLSVVADMRSLAPESCDDAIATLDAILHSVVTESQVSSTTPPAHIPNNGPKHWAIVPKRLEYHPPSENNDEKEK
jgi:hypothetical protein